MAVGLSIRADVKGFNRTLNRIQKKAIPEATRGTLNDLAFKGKKREERSMEVNLNKPVAFTKRGITVKKAGLRDLLAIVKIRNKTWQYLNPVIFGLVEHKKHAIPVGRKPNAKGNLTPAQRKPRKNEFFGTIKGTRGIYRRYKDGRIKLMVHFQDSAKKERHYPWGEQIELLVRKATPGLLSKNLRRALRKYSR